MESLVKQLHTLDTFLFSFVELNKVWKCDKRDGVGALQRFLNINQRAFAFLGINAEIELIGNDPYLRLKTSRYAGCVPMMSPQTGNPCGDLCVFGRFGEDISELLSVIGDTILVEYNDALPPLSTSVLDPPIFFECCNFIDKFIEVEHTRWHKFDIVERIENAPSSGTRWDEYARKSYNPASALSFPNKNNRLRPLHKEFCQLLSVLYTSIKEVQRPQTPIRSRMAYSAKIDRLKTRYKEFFIEIPNLEFVSHLSDPIAVREAKFLANIILQNKRINARSWRMDYSEFFERFIQYIFGEVSKAIGSKAICNPHYSISGHRPIWALHYLEPDMIIQNEANQIILDAKYKSHMFNKDNMGDDLKDTFRYDLHQLLAYCSFNSMVTKKAFMVYPFTEFTYHKLHIDSPLASINVDVYLIGIPLNKSKLEDTRTQLNKIILESSFLGN